MKEQFNIWKHIKELERRLNDELYDDRVWIDERGKMIEKFPMSKTRTHNTERLLHYIFEHRILRENPHKQYRSEEELL